MVAVMMQSRSPAAVGSDADLLSLWNLLISEQAYAEVSWHDRGIELL